MADSMIYTIPLRRQWLKTAFKRRGNRAVRALKEYCVRHTKADRIVIGEELNEAIWANGITNPPSRVKVEVTKTTVKEDNKDVVEAFVNLVGFGRHVVEQKKKNIISKEGKSLKDKLQNAMGTLKGEDKAAETVVDAEAKPVEKTEKAEKPAAKSKPKKDKSE